MADPHQVSAPGVAVEDEDITMHDDDDLSSHTEGEREENDIANGSRGDRGVDSVSASPNISSEYANEHRRDSAGDVRTLIWTNGVDYRRRGVSIFSQPTLGSKSSRTLSPQEKASDTSPPPARGFESSVTVAQQEGENGALEMPSHAVEASSLPGGPFDTVRIKQYAAADEDEDTDYDYNEDYDPSCPPPPPRHLFRLIRKLGSTGTTATWLCLPDKLIDPKNDKSYNGREYTAKTVRMLGKAPAWKVRTPQDAEYIAQVVIVKTSVYPTALRREGELLEYLHSDEDTASSGAGRFRSQSYLGSYVMRQQLTGVDSSSWLCLRPQFGRPLNQFVGWCGQGMLPTWFIWHVFLSLLEALGIAHKKGIANNNVGLDNMALNMYPLHGPNVFREWPDVVLVDFSQATDLADEDAVNDVRNMLQMTRHLIEVYSNIAENLHQPARGMRGDSLATFYNHVVNLLEVNSDPDLTVWSLEAEWKSIAVAGRNSGPKRFPEHLMMYASNELVNPIGLEKAYALNLDLLEQTEMEERRARAKEMRVRQPVAFEKKKEMTGDGKTVIRALCVFKFARIKHLLGDAKLIRDYLELKKGWVGGSSSS
ncbi:unnamed protein product [Periconia digitata]|uniref:Protein kinase domain-containing protein n=1 Tax=Periconia digitata TaxID=1303443 RepID=A0A9W4UNV0_9PLEO|nr:unnamed protein product [Periconia digitata]